MKVASLPMYDLPELREATDAWWSALAAAFRAEGLEGVPDMLLRDGDAHEHWGREDLLFSQTCGYPLTHAWKGRLTCLAAPCYACEGCDGANYCSFVLVGRDTSYRDLADLRGAHAAINSTDSQSGYSALRAVVAPHAETGRFFSNVIETGGHAFSLEAVAEGRADVCAVDAVLWTLLRRHRSEITDRVRVIARTPQTPGLPYVTTPSATPEDVARLRAGLQAALEDTATVQAREALAIADVRAISESDYTPILHMEEQALAAGYAKLA